MVQAAEVLTFPEPSPSTVGKIQRYGMGYVWETDRLGNAITIKIDELSLRSGEYSGMVEVQKDGRHVLTARFNISTINSRGSLVTALNKRGGEALARADVWDKVVDQFCTGVLIAERRGTDLQYAGASPIQPTHYLLDSIIQEGKPNMLFGPGGGGKGMFAVASCVAAQVGRGIGPLTVKQATPIYFDWEDDFETMNARIQRVTAGMEIEPIKIAYKRMKGMFTDRVTEIAREVANAKATFGVIDSVSACAGSPTRGETWDFVAQRLFDALDLIPSGVPGKPMTWLLIDHVTGEKVVPGAIAGKAFGSIQKMNRVRCAWELRSEQDDGSSVVQIVLHHAKWNHTGRKRPIGLTMTFEDNCVIFDKGETKALVIDGPLVKKIAHIIEQIGPQSVRALELALQKPENVVRATLSRGSKEYRFQKTVNDMWILATDDEPTSPEDLPWN